MSDEQWILIIAGVVMLVLITQRWFWLLVFFFSGLAACFAMLASIVHFQIMAALGFFVVTAICWFVAAAIKN